jgi:glycosyltransferase involved in cell wall biosynthesis
VAFSPSSKTILLKAFPDLEPDKIQVITPTYSVDFGPLPFKLPGADKITLGVAGAMYPHKGSRLVAQVEKYARAQDLALRTVVIGSWNDVAPPKSVKVAGAYAVNDLPKIIEREQIDVLLFPSVCPETYSRTLSELFALKVPIVSLDVGAQGDRVSAYEYGVAVSSADPQEIVAALQAAIRKRNEAQEVPADA